MEIKATSASASNCVEFEFEADLGTSGNMAFNMQLTKDLARPSARDAESCIL